MSLSDREQLVQLAREFDALIVTDDVYDFLQWSVDPDCPLAAPDEARVPRLRGEFNQHSLASILGELGIIGWNLHNAGNDARYTLEALVRMICRDTGEASAAASMVG